MAYTEINNVSDLQGLLNFPNTGVPEFWPIMLFVVFIISASTLFFREVKREGRGNFLSSMAVSGFLTTSVALILSLLQVIQGEIVVFTFVFSLVFQVIYLLTNK